MTPFGRNFLPGPTDVRPEVMAAMGGPLFSHRGPRMRAIMEAVQPSLQECFGTAQPVFIATNSGTGLIEAGIRSGVRERVLVASGGYFGEYFARIAESCGKQVFRVEVHPGAAVTPEQLERFLEGPAVDAVAIVHSETSTGALADLPALARVVRARKDVLLLVDGVSAAGAMPIEMDRWGVDYCCTGSQKALALPPGLAFGAASERFLERAEKREDAGYYLSVRRLVTTARENLPWWTPALPLYHALVCQVDLIARSGGWPARWERHARMREAMDRWVAARSDVRLLANGGRSPALSALVIPDTHEVARMVEALEAMGYQVGTALTPKHGPIIRIGHMGDLTPEHLAALLGDISGLLAAPGPVRPHTVLR